MTWDLTRALKCGICHYYNHKQGCEFMHQTFSPKEVEIISSVSTVKQRDLRRRGIIARRPDDGQMKFSLPDLAFFVALNALCDQHITVSVAAEMAGKTAVRVAALALDYWMKYANQNTENLEPPNPKFHCFYCDSDNQIKDFETGDLTEALRAQAVEHNNLVPSIVVLDTRYLAALILERAKKPLILE